MKAAINIVYKRYPTAKGLPLEVDGEWTDDGFEDVAFFIAGIDLRDALDFSESDELAILAQANEAYRNWVKEQRVEREEAYA